MNLDWNTPALIFYEVMEKIGNEMLCCADIYAIYAICTISTFHQVYIYSI